MGFYLPQGFQFSSDNCPEGFPYRFDDGRRTDEWAGVPPWYAELCANDDVGQAACEGAASSSGAPPAATTNRETERSSTSGLYYSMSMKKVQFCECSSPGWSCVPHAFARVEKYVSPRMRVELASLTTKTS